MRVLAPWGYVRGDDWNRGDGDPDRFTRHSFWWLLAFGLFFYGLCALFVVHDLMAYRAFVNGAAAQFWIGERFGRVGAACLFFGLVLFLPAIAVWLLARFFDVPGDDAV
jgi:hypothetical protein